MKKILVLLMIICVGFAGCAPTQVIASKAMEEGLTHAHKVYVNTSDMTKQLILNYGSEQILKAAATDDEEAIKKAIQSMYDSMQDIGYLNIQWERTRSLLRTPQEYIWSQKHFLSILYKDLREAKKRADAKRDAELSVNSP